MSDHDRLCRCRHSTAQWRRSLPDPDRALRLRTAGAPFCVTAGAMRASCCKQADPMCIWIVGTERHTWAVTSNLRIRGCLTLFVSVGLVASVVVGVAPKASATAVWSVVPSPNPAGAMQDQLLGVSCRSTTSCFAVGDYTRGTMDSLVERWNGGSWEIMHSRNPVGFTSASLVGVSCPSTTSCFAVGSYTKFPIVRTLIEHWNGSRWAIMSSPNPTKSRTSQLAGVSCPSETSCFAVGFSLGGGIRPLVEHWNGSRWSFMMNRSPPNDASLGSVSCPSAKSCFAVGRYDSFRGGFAVKSVVEHWNGRGSWSTMLGTPNPTSDTALGGVSCPSPTNCFAVGYSNRSVIEHWGGRGDWSVMASPDLGFGSVLGGVSCSNTTSCVAIGTSASILYGVVEQWNGKSWSLSSTVSLPVQFGLAGVSCPRTNNCFAVGSRPPNTDRSKTLIERYA